MHITRRRLAMMLAAIVAVGSTTTGCRYVPPEQPGAAAARERLDRATELLVAADGGEVTISTVVNDGSTEVSSTCVSVTTEPSSVALERSEVVFGTYVTGADTCAADVFLLVDGDAVYVPTDKLAPGRLDFLQNWAHITPVVREKIADTTPAKGVPYSSLVGTASSILDDGKGTLSIEVDVDALVKAGMLKASAHAAENVSATVTFSFATDGALSEVVYEMTGTGTGTDADTVTVRQEYKKFTEAMDLAIPEATLLNPESATLTTVDAFDQFVGLGG